MILVVLVSLVMVLVSLVMMVVMTNLKGEIPKGP